MAKVNIYVSGHCSTNVVGGHRRCAHVCAGVACVCWCHSTTWLDGAQHIDRHGVAWVCDGAGWYVDA